MVKSTGSEATLPDSNFVTAAFRLSELRQVTKMLRASVHPL